MSGLQVPVLRSLDPDQLQSIYDFMDRLREGDVPAIEAKRLEPYFEGYAQQILRDLNAQDDERLKSVDAKKLSALFKRSADRTDNTILSEILIAPEGMLQDERVIDGNREYGALMRYDSRTFTFSFLQVFKEGSKKTVSIPVMEYDVPMMREITPYQPDKLLRGLQYALTASNHDMQHQFSNISLKDDIARTTLPTRSVNEIEDWGTAYSFNSIGSGRSNSYESWLMLNHMRVFSRLENGKEGAELRASCDSFFDELRRISDDMCGDGVPIDHAHTAIDYFGTMYCFALSRFLPLTHPLMNHAIERLRQADPNPEAVRPKQIALPTPPAETTAAIRNYAAVGLDLTLHANAGYDVWKKRNLIDIAPERVHLLSPAQPGSALARAQERVGDLNRHMVLATINDMDFGLADGVHRFVTGKTTMTKHIKNNDLHNDDGPALIIDGPHRQIQDWYINGIQQRSIHTFPPDIRIERQFEDSFCRHVRTVSSIMQRDVWYEADGTSYEEMTEAGKKTQRWYNAEGKRHRIGAPAEIVTNADGSQSEDYYTNGLCVRSVGASAPKKDPAAPAIPLDWHKINAQLNKSPKPK